MGSRSSCFHFRHRRRDLRAPRHKALRHLAFAVDDLAQAKAWLELHGVAVEPVRVDEYTGRRFTFFSDPDGLPLELYEVVPSTT
jgi:glyoxylase I family protein